MIEILQKTGLSETEAIIYLQLLKSGPLTAVQISKRTKIHRRTIYDNLNMLVNKGLVSYHLENGVHHYKAGDPYALKKMQEEKLADLNGIIPTLQKYHSQSKSDPHVEIRKGSDAARTILIEMKRSKSDILWMGGGFRILDSFVHSKERILADFAQLRARIIQPSPKTNDFKKHFPNAHIRLLPAHYANDTAFFTYDSSTIIGTLAHDDFFIVKIDNPDIAQAYQNHFEIIWQCAKRA